MGATFGKEMAWVEANVPSQEGKVFVITGANSGIGLEAARVLGYKGGKVILACRSESKARQAIEDLVNGVSELSYKSTPSPMKVNRDNIDFLPLDLGDLNSIESFSSALAEKYPKVDVLINNAGLMALPKREETAQGSEMQMGVNVVGHYALTCRLIPALTNSLSAGGAPRIVFVSSGLHADAKTIDFEDFDKKKKYDVWGSYAESKLGDILLAHKFADVYPQFIVDSCHPGLSATNLQDDIAFGGAIRALSQSALMGSLPTVMGEVDATAKSHEYYGPNWRLWGTPARGKTSSAASNAELKEKLYQVCVEKTGLTPSPL